MQRSLKRSKRHFQKANERPPLGVPSNFRYWGEDKTVYVDHEKGCECLRNGVNNSVKKI
jgi:glutamate-1-semialdehyde 2,1-aminomutase